MDERLKPFAESIGEMCNEWAHLEQWVERLFLAIGGWDYRLPNASVMVGCLDFRDQIRAAKAGAVNRFPNGPFLTVTIDCLDYIDNELRSARNRCIHDIWAPAKDGVGAMRINVIARIGKEPGTGQWAVKPWDNHYFKVETVREITLDIVNERQYLLALVKCFRLPGRTQLPKQLVEPPQRLHPRHL